MTQWTGNLNLNALTADFTDNGRTLTTVGTNVPVFGDGTTTTLVTHQSGEYVDKTTQWQLRANPDGSPVLWIGALTAPTYIYDTHYQALDWANGGRFRSLSGVPLVVMQGVNYRGDAPGREASLTGNQQNVAFHLESCNLTWTNAAAVPFLGRGSILKNVNFRGAANYNSDPSSGAALFPSFLLESSNVTIANFGVGTKIEHGGAAWYRGFSYTNCTWEVYCWASASDTSAGLSDGSVSLQDCKVSSNAKVGAEAFGWIKVWRTITGKTALANGTGVSGAYRYVLYNVGGVLTPYAETYTINASAQANYYQTEATAISGLNTQRTDLAVFARPGERLRIAGFTNAALNGDFVVAGKALTRGLAQGNYADTREIWVSGKNSATETTKSITFTVLPPLSTASGAYPDYKIQVCNARRSLSSGNNTLAAMLAGTNVQAGYYERNSWMVVEIPPYPYVRQSQDFSISTWAATAGETVQWNTLAINDPQIEVTNAATVAAYTTLETAEKIYDYAEWLKRQPAYHAVPNLYDGIVTRSGKMIDAGAFSVVIDANAQAPMTVAGGAITIKAASVDAGFVTTGIVTLLNGATISGAVEDANGVRVTVRKSGGGNFNIAARYGTTGSYTDLGYTANTSTITYTVPKGTPVEVAMWSLGHMTYRREISTAAGGVVFEAEMTVNTSIDTALDVSGYLANINVTNGGGQFKIVFEADMDVPGIEVAKAIVHRIVGLEIPLRAGLPPTGSTIIEILSDEIKINRPYVFLTLGTGATDVIQRGYINTAPAVAIDPTYIVNPRRESDNLKVEIPLNKPTLDASVLALAVWQNTIESQYTAQDLLKLSSSILLGRVSGARTGTEVFRDAANTKDRVIVNVDAVGNRTSITLDPS